MTTLTPSSFTFTAPEPAAQSTPLAVLVTGASRGLGLELVKQYATAHSSNLVIAASRSSSPALTTLSTQLPNIHLVSIDVADEDSIRTSVSKVSSITPHLDLLLNNAGIHGPDEARDPLKVSKAQLTEVFNTNVTGVVLMTQAYLPLLRKSKEPKVVNLGSSIGSNANAVAFGPMYYSITYGVSKAALNYATTAFRFAEPMVTFLCIHPGWIDTDMGSGGVMGKAPNSAEASVKAIRYWVAEKKIDSSGEYLDVTTGKTIPY